MTPSHGTPSDVPRDTLTLKAAAARAGVSVSTVRRRKDALIAAGATVDPSGWVIPYAALEAVFLTPHERAHGTPSATPVDTPSDGPLVEQLRTENARLWEQVEQQARTIERQAEAHAVISAQLTKLGQLEAGPAQPTPAANEQPAPAANEQPAPPRRWWWQRR